MAQYLILQYSWIVERMRDELNFPTHPPFLNEVYESDEEYYRDGFGKDYYDLQKVLSHAAWAYNRFISDNSLKGDLIRDFKNLLCCMSLFAAKDYVDQYLKMLCGLGLGKEAYRVLSEYLAKCQSLRDGERISFREAPDLKQTYINAGDHALFLKEDADTAIGFYKLAGANWNIERDKNNEINTWRKKATIYEKLLQAEIPEEPDWAYECKAAEYQSTFQSAIRLLSAYQAEGIEKTDELVLRAKKTTDREKLRTLHIMLEAIRRKYAMQVLYILSQDPDKERYRKQIIWWGRELYDKRYQLLKKYMPEQEVDFDKETVTEQMFLAAEVVYLTDKISEELRVKSFDEPVCYYAPYDSFKYMLPCNCSNREDSGRLTIMHVNYMNDPNEGQMIRRFVYGDDYGKPSGRQSIDTTYTFMKCFTHMPDYLPMWNTYADGAMGVSVTLNTEELILYRVCYVSKTESSSRKKPYSVIQKYNDKKKINTVFIQNSLDKLIEIYEKMKSEDNTQLFDNLLSPIQFLFKEKSYSYEQETRLIIEYDRLPAGIKKTVANKEKKEEPKLFILSEKPVKIEELILGPKHPNIAHNVPFIKSQLDEMAEITGLDAPKVTISEIEFR